MFFANPVPSFSAEETRKMLLPHGVILEELGGDVQSVPISALNGTNLPQLIEAIALQAEIMELKADPTGLVEGLVIESKTDPHRGKLSTALVQRGTLRKGSVLVSGIAWARVRAMFDEAGKPVLEAPPSTPVEILGWRELPEAGDEIIEVESEKFAHEVVKYREHLQSLQKQDESKEIVMARAAEHQKVYKAQLEAKRKMGRYKLKPTGPREKEIKDDDTGPNLNVVIKGDVGGSLEAILDVLETYDCQKDCKLSLIHYGVGNVSENDVQLAEAFRAIIYPFNVEIPAKVNQLAKSKKINIKPHNVIYHLVDDIKEEIDQLLPPKQVEDVTGEANVQQFFEVTEGKKKVGIAGSRCVKGVLKKGSKIRVIRNQDIIYEGKLQALRHLKAEVDSIKKDTECGVRVDAIDVKFQPGDVLQCYSIRDEPQHCAWDPGF